MRIVVFSDCHGDVFRALEVVRRNEKEKLFVFLGDGADVLDTLRQQFPQKEFIGVRGNCDFFCNLPDEYMIDVEGVKILCTHGHLYGVKFSEERLITAARGRNAQIVLYGHTHRAVSRYIDGLYIVCPGSISRPADFERSYATIDIVKQGIFCNIVRMSER